MSKVALIVVARTGSSRLPNKMLLDLGGKPVFMHTIERITSVIDPDYVVVACTREACDDPIELFAKQYGIDCFRGEDDPFFRTIAVGRSLGLENDDIMVYARCDEPLGVYKYIPYAIEQMDKHDCDYCLADVPVGTLLWALNPSCEIRSFGVQVEISRSIHIVGELSIMRSPFYCSRKMIHLKFPPEYLAPWPWGRLLLDWVHQGCIIKEIYQQLYKGFPIDVFDVYDLMKQQLWFANLIPLEVSDHPKEGDLIKCIKSTRAMLLEECEILGMDIIELTWKGGQNKKLEHGKNPKKNTGGKCVTSND